MSLTKVSPHSGSTSGFEFHHIHLLYCRWTLENKDHKSLALRSKMDLCARPIRIGALYEYATIVPKCRDVLGKDTPFTPEAFYQACPIFRWFIDSIKLTNRAACSDPLQKILLKVLWFKTENETNPLISELSRGNIDVVPQPYFYDDPRLENLTWSQPFMFFHYVVLTGPKSLIPRQSPLTLPLAPFTPLVWLLCILSLAIVASVDCFRMKVRRSKTFFYLSQLMGLLYLIHCSYLRAVTSLPSSPQLPFKDLQELGNSLNQGKLTLVDSETFCSDYLQIAKELIPGLHHIYQPLCNYSFLGAFEVVSRSENLVTISDEAGALENLHRIGSESLANVRFFPLSSMPEMGGFYVSKRARQLGEELSRASEIVGAMDRLEIDRLSNRRSWLIAADVRKRTQVDIGHLKLAFLIGAVGHAIALVVLVLEKTVLLKRMSLDLTASRDRVTEMDLRSMDVGIYRRKPAF